MRHQPSRIHFLRPKAVAIILTVALIGTMSLLIRYQSLTPAASTDVTTTTRVSVDFCSEGDTATTCAPSKNTYSEHAVSNTLSMLIEQEPLPSPLLCIQAETEAPLRTSLRGTITIKDQTGQIILQKKELISDEVGKITTPLSQVERWTTDGTATLKADGYFARTLTVTAYDPNVCLTYAQDTKLISGDFDNDGSLTFDDVTLILKGYRGTNLLFVPAVFGEQHPTFDNVLEIIKKYRKRKDYHDA